MDTFGFQEVDEAHTRESNIGVQETEKVVDIRKISDLDADRYIGATRVKEGEDSYQRNAFNQKASDNIPIDRDVPDVRDPQ